MIMNYLNIEYKTVQRHDLIALSILITCPSSISKCARALYFILRSMIEAPCDSMFTNTSSTTKLIGIGSSRVTSELLEELYNPI